MSDPQHPLSLYDFSMMQIISGPTAREFLTKLDQVGAGERTIGIHDPVTGFCLKVVTLNGAPLQWFIRGPLTAEQARLELGGPMPPASNGLH